MSVLNQRESRAALRLVPGPRKGRAHRLPAIDAPEARMPVSFAGLTEAEQLKALAGFPGGKRFVLVRETH